MIDRPTEMLVQAYRAFKDGLMPAPGGFSDQSRLFLRWVNIIDNERFEIDDAQRRIDESPSRRRG